MFDKIKKQVYDRFIALSKSQTHLFIVNPDRDKIWEIYLNAFVDPIEKQEHTCNYCKSFLRQFGGIVAIIDNKVQSIWDLTDVDELYAPSINALKEYIYSLPVADVFYAESAKCGTDKNADRVKNVIWTHFFIEVDRKFVHSSSTKSVESVQSDKRSTREVFKRSLEELTDESLSSVLELIDQGSIYRGNEFRHIVEGFIKAKKEYNKLKSAAAKEAFTWTKSIELPDNVAKIRNISIGTLLIDISEGLDLDAAVTKFERSVLAPANYKRPSAIVTKKMIEEARTAINALGYADSLDRRYARPEDVGIENLLFIDKSSTLKDVFDELTGAVTVDPKTLKKLEEVSIEQFLTKIVPTSKKIEVLLENSHINKMVSLVTASNKDVKGLFKWNNPFSWSYTGGITDTMKERVKAAGGNVTGVLRFSIQWNEDGKSICDLDAHAVEPNGNELSFRNRHAASPMSGQLDVDMINPPNVGVENIVWTKQGNMKPGTYRMFIHNYNSGFNTGFTAQVEFNGEIYDFAYNKKMMDEMDIATVTLDKNGNFSIKNHIDGSSKTISKDVWGLKTNQFVKVKQLMLSPNHWNGATGNKHYIFALENAVSDESPRPFFNEFLNDELMTSANKRMFEVLGSKIKVEDSTPQVSGLGFSDTQRNSLIVRVTGTFARTLKINF